MGRTRQHDGPIVVSPSVRIAATSVPPTTLSISKHPEKTSKSAIMLMCVDWMLSSTSYEVVSFVVSSVTKNNNHSNRNITRCDT